jgi:hypothetical protein
MQCQNVVNNDSASSAAVQTNNDNAQICFYTDSNCNGNVRCFSFEQIRSKGSPADFAKDGMNDKISSFQYRNQCRPDQTAWCDQVLDRDLLICDEQGPLGGGLPCVLMAYAKHGFCISRPCG